MPPLGQNCHLQTLGSGRIVVKSRNTGFWMVDGLYEGHSPFRVVRRSGEEDAVIVDGEEIEVTSRAYGEVIPPPALVQALLYFDADFVTDPTGSPIVVSFEKEARSSLLNPEAGFGSSFTEIVFGSGDGDGLAVRCDLLRLWFHIYSSVEFSGRAPEYMGNPPFANGTGVYNVTFDVEEAFTDDFGTATWDFVETKTYEVTLTAATLPTASARDQDLSDTVIGTMGHIDIADSWLATERDAFGIAHYIRFTNWNFELA